MKNKLTIGASVLAAALVFSASAAQGAVTMNSDGVGFVGKGDVQMAFGWNDRALQANAGGVTFNYVLAESFAITCSWTTGEGTKGEKTHHVDRTTTASVIGTLAYDTRKNKNKDVTGFILDGFGTMTTSGEVPEIGDTCLGAGAGATVTAIETPVDEFGIASVAVPALFVSHGTNTVLLP
jgi:hypothetical protein